MADAYYAAAKAREQTVDYVLYNNEPHGWYNWCPETVEAALIKVDEHLRKFIGQ
jgi:hypothetical protein